MNYIELINNAWELREQGIISVNEHDLYCYLVHKCNKLGWKNPFNQATSIICAVLGISRNGLTNRRNKLNQLGLIKFKEGNKGKSSPAIYTICILKDTLPDTLTDTLTDTLPDTLTDTLTDTNTINKTKQNKTKKNNNSCFSDFETLETGNKKEKSCAKKEKFKKPTLKEITDYCKERNNTISPWRFFNYYESNGWKIGKSPMKDWKAAIRTWEDNNFHSQQPKSKLEQNIEAGKGAKEKAMELLGIPS